MKNHEIIFRLNGEEKITIECAMSLEDIHCCSEASIVFTVKQHKYALQRNSIRFNLQCLKGILEKALASKLELHKCITKDIGYLYNEKLQNKSNAGLMYEEDGDGRKWWIGERYSLWYGKFPTWIYNNSDGEIIFEMTPYFPGKPTYSQTDEPLTSEEIVNSAWYDQWIKDYKPILIRVISRDVAEKWLEQANEILEQIEKNIIKMRAEGRF